MNTFIVNPDDDEWDLGMPRRKKITEDDNTEKLQRGGAEFVIKTMKVIN